MFDTDKLWELALLVPETYSDLFIAFSVFVLLIIGKFCRRTNPSPPTGIQAIFDFAFVYVFLGLTIGGLLILLIASFDGARFAQIMQENGLVWTARGTFLTGLIVSVSQVVEYCRRL